MTAKSRVPSESNNLQRNEVIDWRNEERQETIGD